MPNYRWPQIIALAANSFKEDIDSAMNTGTNSHHAKPIDRDNLLIELAKFLNPIADGGAKDGKHENAE